MFNRTIDRYKDNSENLSKTKVGEHIPLDFSMFTISSFEDLKYKHDVYRGKDCMKKFFGSLRKQAIKWIKLKKKKNEVINQKAAGVVWKCKICYI